jgi:WD40-like Beta Propeller Repeat
VRLPSVGVALAVALLVGGCGQNASSKATQSTAPGIVSISPSATAVGPAPSPSISPDVATGNPSPANPWASVRCSAKLSSAPGPLGIIPPPAGGTGYRIADLSNPANPTNLCALDGGVRDITFISKTEIGFALSSSSNDPIRGTTQLERMSLVDLKITSVVSFPGDALAIAWSPDGTTVAYLVYTEEPANRLWIKVGDATPTALTPPIPLFGRDGSINDQLAVRFSSDGKYLLMVDTWVSGAAPSSPDQATVQVRSMPDGRLVWVPPSALQASGGKGGPFITMAAWSHLSNRLYYRDSTGIHTWDSPSTVGDLAPGLVWLAPSISPDDRVIAYMAYVDGQPRIEIRNLASGSTRNVPGTTGYPTMLTNSSIYGRHMAPNDQMGPPYLETTGFEFDLQTGQEVEVPNLPGLVDTWPH